MNLFQLRAFDAVAREGSFTRAAARLFISQPAVTGHIKALEEHYQITLLRRTARRVELTEEGTKLAAITRAMFGLAEEAQTMLEANRQLLTGRLEVAAAVSRRPLHHRLHLPRSPTHRRTRRRPALRGRDLRRPPHGLPRKPGLPGAPLLEPRTLRAQL